MPSDPIHSVFFNRHFASYLAWLNCTGRFPPSAEVKAMYDAQYPAEVQAMKERLEAGGEWRPLS